MTRQQLKGMSLDELRSMRDLIHKEIEQRGQEIKCKLRIGDKVKVNHNRTTGMTFIVVEIKRKKAVVATSNGTRYNVALPLLEKAQ